MQELQENFEKKMGLHNKVILPIQAQAALDESKFDFLTTVQSSKPSRQNIIAQHSTASLHLGQIALYMLCYIVKNFIF